jgi:DNA-binding response OmpR family regulator
MDILISCNKSELKDLIISHLTMKNANSIKCSNNGSDALEIASHHNIDLALISKDLEDYDSLLLIDDLRRLYPKLKIIYFGSFSNTQEVIDAYATQNIFCINVPFHLTELDTHISMLHRESNHSIVEPCVDRALPSQVKGASILNLQLSKDFEADLN